MFRPLRSLGATALLAVLALASAAGAQSDKIAMIATLDAAQVPTGSTSTGMGTAVVVIDPAFNIATITVVIDGLAGAETQAHIHGYAPPGGSGPPVHTLPLGLKKTSTWFYPQADEANLLTDLAYVSVHTGAFPAGELRGQLIRVRREYTVSASLDKNQVVGGSTSPANGLFVATIDPLTNSFDYSMTMTGSTLQGAETASHVYGYAAPGFAGLPQHTLANGFHKSGSWTYPEADEASILGGLAYAQVLTAANPAGEIRGQILTVAHRDPADRISLVADLDAAQVVGGSSSTARGTACMTLDTRSNIAELLMVVDGLAGAETASHVYGYAPPGGGGTIRFTLPNGAYKSAVWIYPEAQEASLLAGQGYVQVLTGAFPSGEIRGQLERAQGHAVLVGDMDAAQVVSGSASPARGLFCASLDTEAQTLTYQMTMTATTLMGAESAASIDGFAVPGAGGSSQHALPLGFHKSGVWNYPPADEASILDQLAWAEVDTAANPSGEIRGQLRLASTCEPAFTSYCTAGTSASGCQALLVASGFPSSTLSSGFTLSVSGFEGAKDGLFFFGTNGRQANSWGNGTSLQCVVPPVKRGGLLPGAGTNGLCNNAVSQDLNALWCSTCPKPPKKPGAGATVQIQLWYRDPLNTSNQTTSLSDALEFTLCP